MRRQIPSTTALLCFEAAARTENFARAAREINLTQSAFSRQIQSLEDYAKQTLFTRDRQRVKLTTAGQTLSAELTPLLERLEGALLSIRSHNRSGGAINVGVYPTLGSRWLMPRILQLTQDNDDLTINTITYLSNAAIDPSLVDLAIVQGNPPWPGFRSDFLMAETLVVVGSPQLVEKPVLDASKLLARRILQHSTRPKSWEIWFASLNEVPHLHPIGPMFTQFEMLIDAVKGSHGLAIIPAILVQKELAEGTLVKAHAHECAGEGAYYLLIPNAKTGTQKIEQLRRWFLNQVN
ncbi:MAG: LysR family transcriptional regulator [Alphaproteobacteria bacterium]|nr:LysR family transcriptional regulator [Alphaproteobacteria bacterium]